jgi:hypothetical protein
MYSDGNPLGFGIGIGGERWREQRKFASKVLSELSERRKGILQSDFYVADPIKLFFFVKKEFFCFLLLS